MYNFPNQLSEHDTLDLFDILYKKDMSNNSSYFHFNIGELSSVSKQKCLDRFKQNIKHYNTIIDKIQEENIIDNNVYQSRTIIKKLLVDYEEILNSINVYKANR